MFRLSTICACTITFITSISSFSRVYNAYKNVFNKETICTHAKKKKGNSPESEEIEPRKTWAEKGKNRHNYFSEINIEQIIITVTY